MFIEAFYESVFDNYDDNNDNKMSSDLIQISSSQSNKEMNGWTIRMKRYCRIFFDR